MALQPAEESQTEGHRSRRPGPRILKFCPFLKLTSAERDLVLKASQGDEVAFSEFVRRKAKWLFRKVRRSVGNDEDAFDAVQDILLALWRNLARYDPKYSPSQWLGIIAFNKCRDRARRTVVRGKAIAEFGTIEKSTASLEALLIREQALQRLYVAIDRLPANYKTAIFLTVVEDLSQREAGERLGVSEKAVETRLYHARLQLAGMLRAGDLSDLIGAETYEYPADQRAYRPP